MAGAKVGNARVGERGLVDEEVAGAQTVFGPSGPRKVEPVGRAGDVSPRTVPVISEIAFNSVSTPFNRVR